jgi:hypothetical protein
MADVMLCSPRMHHHYIRQTGLQSEPSQAGDTIRFFPDGSLGYPRPGHQPVRARRSFA